MQPEASLLAEDIVVTGVDPSNGRLQLGGHEDILVEAALVIDLARAGRVALTGTGVDTRVLVVDPRPVAHPVLRKALAWLHQNSGPPTAADLAELEGASWLTRRVAHWMVDREGPAPKLSGALRGIYARDRVVEQLVSTGTLQAREHRFLGLTSSYTYAVTPPARREQMVDDLRTVLLDGREPDQRTGPLLGLLGVANVFASSLHGAAHLARWAPRSRRTEADERAHQLAETEWDVEGVRTAIGAVDAIIDARNKKPDRFSSE